MSSGGKDRGAREARERSRLYQARQSFHEGQSTRRTRDNLIAGIGGGILILAVVGAQTLYFTVGPGVPAPTPSPSTSVTSTPGPTDTPVPLPTDLPQPTPSVTE